MRNPMKESTYKYPFIDLLNHLGEKLRKPPLEASVDYPKPLKFIRPLPDVKDFKIKIDPQNNPILLRHGIEKKANEPIFRFDKYRNSGINRYLRIMEYRLKKYSSTGDTKNF